MSVSPAVKATHLPRISVFFAAVNMLKVRSRLIDGEGESRTVSKRKDSLYRSGPLARLANPVCAAVKREEEEDWGRRL